MKEQLFLVLQMNAIFGLSQYFKAYILNNCEPALNEN